MSPSIERVDEEKIDEQTAAPEKRLPKRGRFPKPTSPVVVLLAIIATILSVGALQATRPVTMPLAFAVLVAILVNPLRNWLNQRFPRWLSLIIVLAAILAVLSLLGGLLSVATEQAAPQLPQYADRLEQTWQTASSWLQDRGFPVQTGSSQTVWREILGRAANSIRGLLGSASLGVLVLSLLALLLLEVDDYRDRAQAAFSSYGGRHIIHAFSAMSRKLRRYFIVMTFTSFITGILTLLWCWLLGVDLAIVWALIAFVLNFVPTLGSIVAAVLPAIAALLFLGPTKAIITLAGLAVMQTVLGNFVDPKLQGKYLQLSPFMALLSIIFWGWVWGIPGAFIGVPMTTAIVLLTGEFRATRSIAILMGDSKDNSR